MTAVQSQVPDRLQPEINAFQETVRTMGPGLGFLLGGAIAAAASPRATYFVAGLGALAVALAATAVWRRANVPDRLLTAGH
jgi:NAD/NADP transhydrogenase alpha subunit